MKSPLALAIAAAALLPLAACNSNQEAANIAAANAEAANVAASIELPPAIAADKSFRCRDNSLAFVTFFEGGTQANVRETQDGPATVLRAPAAGEPLTAEGGWSMTGDENGVTLTRPGKEAISCRA